MGHSLIDKAVEVCGSRYRLSKLTGISQPQLSGVVAGTRPLSAKDAALIADIAGLDPMRAMASAVIESATDETERARLTRVFFRATVQAMLLFFIIGVWLAPSNASAEKVHPPRSAPVTTCESNGLYIMSTRFGAWLRRCLRLAWGFGAVDRPSKPAGHGDAFPVGQVAA